MSLSEEQIVEFKAQLLAWREELAADANRSLQAMHEESETNFPDPNDQATMETDRDLDLRIRDRERKLVRKIDQAMDRIKEGIFGICESCGGDIAYRRLLARPVTTLCIDCKTAQEHEERTRVE